MIRTRLTKNHKSRLRPLLRGVKVVYTDLDNTLLGPGGSIFAAPDQSFSIKPAASLMKLLESGVDVVIVSGRNVNQLREISRLLGLRNYISELGCLVSYSGTHEIVRNYDFPVPVGKTLHEAISASGAPAFLLKNFGDRLEYHKPWSENQTCTHLLRGRVDVETVNNLLQSSGFEGLRVVDNGGTRSAGNLHLDQDARVYHLLPTTTSKASAIRADQAKRGLRLEETIAIGDSLADIEMAETVGAFFMVADGVSENPQLKSELDSHENTFLTSKNMGLGWSEVADLIVPEPVPGEKNT